MPFRVVVSNEDESLRSGEDGPAAVERLARAKALAVARRETLPVLAADTEVLLDGHVLGKPADETDAIAMLRRLSRARARGRDRRVPRERGRAALGGGAQRRALRADVATSRWRGTPRTGEPLDKAGGYHVDGRGALFIETVEGSPSNVAGLPVRLVLRLAREAGLDLGWPA